MRLMSLAVAAALALTACGQKPAEAPTDGESVRKRAQEAQTARRRTGAEVQERALNRVIRTVYLCNNGERLSVDFDNPRAMATVRNSNGEAVDLFMERPTSGLWYRASGYELRGEGVMARWTADGREPTDCRAVD
ncbi:MliC family protein [Brevundimonas sp.]|uniref:MliC family protein n=1 Tax=Brevundimonas sp. TaxID=1871086 RepID=UPI002D30FD05|nr:MliC family protein [Brevundimonas sp.]HYC97111.1 MliC family protein [Brevundimonas sp.]